MSEAREFVYGSKKCGKMCIAERTNGRNQCQKCH